ncbi:thiol reductant ABC exporter subunit CydD [Nocardiopsis alba]|uniref:thiol reductant ABC exporter subunit CydD n=1 Tax=Nocardiopsis alba TaxID=53437 RepID=UPI0033B084C1
MSGTATAEARSRIIGAVPALRGRVAALVVLTTATAVLILVQADLLAALLVDAFTGAAPGVWPVAALVTVAAGRGALYWAGDALARRAAADLKESLRHDLLSTVDGGPAALSGRRRGELLALTTRGLDSLDTYVTGYLPALLPAVIVPVAVLVRITVADPVSAIVIVVTLPLIPLFGFLVGRYTQRATDRQWGRLRGLAGHFSDVVAGLPTLRLFGRARRQARVVGSIAEEHRSATMRTLRIAFLSALVLELAAAVSVALIAVPIGLRLVDGAMTLHVGLLVLILAPEAYLPLRALGARFHSGAEGLSVATDAFERVDRARDAAPPAPAVRSRPNGPMTLSLEGVGYTYPDRHGPAVRDLDLTVRPLERLALVGPSGAGKSTLLSLVLGLVRPEHGRVLVNGLPLEGEALAELRSRTAWVGQRPYLFAGSVRDNVVLARPDASDSEVARALADSGLDAVMDELPEGPDTLLGEGGTGLSSGQRQRVALARAHLRRAELVLLDEPTAHLDPVTEGAVLRSANGLIEGRTAVVVTHRHAALDHVTRVATMVEGRLTDPGHRDAR